MGPEVETQTKNMQSQYLRIEENGEIVWLSGLTWFDNNISIITILSIEKIIGPWPTEEDG